MRPATILLLGLLVVTNAAWALLVLPRAASPGTPGASPAPDRVAALTAEVQRLEAELDAERARAEPAAPAATAADREAEERRRTAEEKRRAAAQRAEEKAARLRAAGARVASFRADVLQIESPARREDGLAGLESAIRSADPELATSALRSLYALRDAPYDKARFGAAVRSRLDDADADVRRAAAYALLQVAREDSDLDRLLDVLEAHPEERTGLVVAAWLSKNRVEGRLADLYVEALAVEDLREAKNTANQLRGMWVSEEVENAVLAAFRREGGNNTGLWWHILGQIRPTREARVRLIFEVLKEDDTSAPQLLDRALDPRNLEPSAASVAAELAAEGLASAPNALIRSLCLKVLRESGTPEQIPSLRAYADNPMVSEKDRAAAAAAADAISRRE